jgi:hypothetical protein
MESHKIGDLATSAPAITANEVQMVWPTMLPRMMPPTSLALARTMVAWSRFN